MQWDKSERFTRTIYPDSAQVKLPLDKRCTVDLQKFFLNAIACLIDFHCAIKDGSIGSEDLRNSSHKL